MRRAEPGHHHHIAGPYLLRYAQEASWREDHRRVSAMAIRFTWFRAGDEARASSWIFAGIGKGKVTPKANASVVMWIVVSARA